MATRSNIIFQQMKLGTPVFSCNRDWTIHFLIILIIESHLQGQKVNFS